VRLDLAIEDEAGEALLRSVAERLTFLRRVDSGEADLVLGLGGVEYGDRVAVGDAYDAALNDPELGRKNRSTGAASATRSPL
jgi:hypothetical protein